MKKGYLTTFQAADILSVTPDSVLKWIKSGKLEARRTPGGHYRILEENIQVLLDETDVDYDSDSLKRVKEFKYCWEFNADSKNCSNNCEQCMVFKARALRCFEMSNIPTELGFLKKYCTSTCADCDYYRIVKAHN